MTGTHLLGSIKEAGPIAEDKLTTQHILQGLQVTKRLRNHRRWPQLKFDTLSSDLDSHPHAQAYNPMNVTLHLHA